MDENLPESQGEDSQYPPSIYGKAVQKETGEILYFRAPDAVFEIRRDD
jgi:hypothetical protein